MQQRVVEKISFSELEKVKIEKVKLITQRLNTFYCITVFNVGGCLASSLA